MTSHRKASQSSGNLRRMWWTVSAVTMVVGLASMAVWIGQSPATQLGASPQQPAPSLIAAVPSQPTPPVKEDSRPVRISIPVAGVSAAVGQLGLQADGTVEVPSDPDQAGWFRLGPPPGDIGSSVILGHVDSKRGPAVFAKLKTLRAGHQLVVEKADGTFSTFRVTSVATYLNADFPARRVYGRTKGRWLSLVTCGGAYDSSRGGYQSNVVVEARWVKPLPTEATLSDRLGKPDRSQ